MSKTHAQSTLKTGPQDRFEPKTSRFRVCYSKHYTTEIHIHRKLKLNKRTHNLHNTLMMPSYLYFSSNQQWLKSLKSMINLNFPAKFSATVKGLVSFKLLDCLITPLNKSLLISVSTNSVCSKAEWLFFNCEAVGTMQQGSLIFCINYFVNISIYIRKHRYCI